MSLLLPIMLSPQGLDDHGSKSGMDCLVEEPVGEIKHWKLGCLIEAFGSLGRLSG